MDELGNSYVTFFSRLYKRFPLFFSFSFFFPFLLMPFAASRTGHCVCQKVITFGKDQGRNVYEKLDDNKTRREARIIIVATEGIPLDRFFPPDSLSFDHFIPPKEAEEGFFTAYGTSSPLLPTSVPILSSRLLCSKSFS